MEKFWNYNLISFLPKIFKTTQSESDTSWYVFLKNEKFTILSKSIITKVWHRKMTGNMLPWLAWINNSYGGTSTISQYCCSGSRPYIFNRNNNQYEIFKLRSLFKRSCSLWNCKKRQFYCIPDVSLDNTVRSFRKYF